MKKHYQDAGIHASVWNLLRLFHSFTYWTEICGYDFFQKTKRVRPKYCAQGFALLSS